MSARLTLYRFFAADDVLLYIGITGDPETRWRSHGRKKPWWRQVALVKVEHFDARDDLIRAEVQAIKAEKPLHNVVHIRTGPRQVARAEVRAVPECCEPSPAGLQLTLLRQHRHDTDVSSESAVTRPEAPDEPPMTRDEGEALARTPGLVLPPRSFGLTRGYDGSQGVALAVGRRSLVDGGGWSFVNIRVSAERWSELEAQTKRWPKGSNVTVARLAPTPAS